MEVKVFQVVQLYESMSTGCSPMGYIFIIFFLYDILDDYNVLWGVLFIIELLTRLSYLTYVGFLNRNV